MGSVTATARVILKPIWGAEHLLKPSQTHPGGCKEEAPIQNSKKDLQQGEGVDKDVEVEGEGRI